MTSEEHQTILNTIGVRQWVCRGSEKDMSIKDVDKEKLCTKSGSNNNLKKLNDTDYDNVAHTTLTKNHNDNIYNTTKSTISETIKKCRLCELTDNPFVGIGLESATLMVVSEQVNRQSKGVFNDIAEQIFQQMMSSLVFHNIFVTAIVKCPIQNKSQLSNASICVKHLETQINEIKPKAILCLGSIASQHLLKKTSPISKLRTYENSWNDIPVIATFHPDYLIHQPSKKKFVWYDLLKLKTML